MKKDLEERLLRFSINVILAVRAFPKGKEFQVISYQIIKSATAVGANYQEAQGAVSKADFANKIGITLNSFKLFEFTRKLVIFCSDKVFFELHSRATERKKDFIRAKKNNFLAN